MREAIKKSEAAFMAHLYLGIVLAHLKSYTESEAELLKSISLAGGKLGQAHYYLGGLYWKIGKYKRAADELEKYLELEPKAANADRVRSTIKDLRTKS
jgi:tetratricopeptide (TPR) repeat protein